MAICAVADAIIVSDNVNNLYHPGFYSVVNGHRVWTPEFKDDKAKLPF